MEGRIGGGEADQVYYYMDPKKKPSSSSSTDHVEWDPKHWKWDGDLFIATPDTSINNNIHHQSTSRHLFFPLMETGITTTSAATPAAAASSISNTNSTSSCCSDEFVNDNRRRTNPPDYLERKRRANADDDDDDNNNNLGDLTLNLLDGGIGILGGGGGKKKSKLGGAAAITSRSSSSAVCQVEDCGVDLSSAKDYHRRHKVCQFHSKATKALVANHLQRFCQQCSRFHALAEFDEGKRSCRRRLDGHNKRRRKTQPPDNNVANNTSSVNDNHSSTYVLMSILRILSSMHSTSSNCADDQDLLSHLFRCLAGHGSFPWEKQVSGHLQESQNLINNLASLGNSELVSDLLSNSSFGQRPTMQHFISPDDQIARTDVDLPATTSQTPGIVLPVQATGRIYDQGREMSGGMNKLNNFDLNDVYVDSDDGMDDLERSTVPLGLVTGSNESPPWVLQPFHQSSPPQTSGNSDSASAHSPSTSSGDAQSRTDRIVFKLFGKEPGDFPIILRAQIFDWLSHSPTDIESYIRPGCVILTIYLRLSESTWEELCFDLSSSLSRLLDFSNDVNFWSTGWIYVRVLNQIAFIYNGQVVIDTSLPFGTDSYSTILSVKPIAVTSSGQAQFTVKGFNLSRPPTRLLCALEGNYLDADVESVEHVDSPEGLELQSLSFSCSMPAVIGRGFIEVEDHGLSSSFFPFIVAEEDVCSEIRMLEKEIESTDRNDLLPGNGRFELRAQAMEFINEMGWLLHKLQLRSRFGPEDLNLCQFPFKRFKYLVEFSMDRDWCAVVTKLLDFLFCGVVQGGEQPFLKFALSEMGLLHRAVRRNSRSLVEMLLRYVPKNIADELSLEYKSLVGIDQSFLFRPDVAGPGGLTPLHVAAGRDGSEDTLDALTDDPNRVGIGAWKSVLDSTGFTPEDYARLRGHYSYIHLVRRKINKTVSSGHVVVDISDTLSDSSIVQKANGGATASFEIGSSKVNRIQRPCGVCDQKLAWRTGGRTLLYRPTMLSMLAIAAVCVCVALLFKSSPRVLFVFRPFSWEMLEYGAS